MWLNHKLWMTIWEWIGGSEPGARFGWTPLLRL
jgi:hypothetical protein